MEIRPELLAVLPPEIAEIFRALVAENAELRARLAELERRLGMNSTNSSKPPSTDSMSKPNKPERREGSGTRKGKREREGKTRPDFGEPDKIEPVRATECPGCCAPIGDSGKLVDRRQVAELVPKPFEITEYQFFQVTCPCCGKVIAPPEAPGVLPGFSLGPRMVALIGLLDHFGNVTYNKIGTMLREGFGLPICEGTIDNANRWLHAALAAPVAELKEVLPKLDRVNMDETGWRIDGRRHWLWTVANESLTYLHIAPSRGAKVVVGLLSQAYQGLISCDFWTAYRAVDGVKGERSFCWSHLDREAKGIIDNATDKADDAQFGRDLRYVIHWGYIHWRGHKRGRISTEVFQLLGERHKNITRGMIAHYDGKLVGKKAIALRKRLAEHLDGYFNWYNHPGVAPDNNAGELAIRPSVITRKVSGGNRSAWGAELTAYMQTVIGTCRKQGIQLLGTIQAYLTALAHPGTPFPSLVPDTISSTG